MNPSFYYKNPIFAGFISNIINNEKTGVNRITKPKVHFGFDNIEREVDLLDDAAGKHVSAIPAMPEIVSMRWLEKAISTVLLKKMTSSLHKCECCSMDSMPKFFAWAQ